MAFVMISGEPGCRTEEVARLTAQLLRFEFVSESMLRAMFAQEFGSESVIPDKAWAAAASSILARLAVETALVVTIPDGELLFAGLKPVLRARVVAPESRRVGLTMLEHRMERPAAQQLLRQLERQEKEQRKRRFGRGTLPGALHDVILSAEHMDSAHLATLLEQAARTRGISGDGRLPEQTEAQIQFQMRLTLAKFGITPPAKVALKRKPFANPSEEIFANMLNFYRIAWEYEPRSFPIQFGSNGKITEAFTPDFYLPEFDLYVELTTMKQAHVTKKNRKVKLLRSLYPHINIQVFYQKDFRDLIFKHGLTSRTVAV
jgi:hypothetical protein